MLIITLFSVAYKELNSVFETRIERESEPFTYIYWTSIAFWNYTSGKIKKRKIQKQK